MNKEQIKTYLKNRIKELEVITNNYATSYNSSKDKEDKEMYYSLLNETNARIKEVKGIYETIFIENGKPEITYM